MMLSKDETWDSSSVGRSGSQEVLSASLLTKALIMTEAEVLRICEKYHFSSAFHVHVPK